MVLGRSLITAVGAAVLVCGCGSAGHTKARTGHPRALTKATVCRSTAHRAAAHALGVSPASVATAGSLGNNLMPQCTFTVPVAGSHVQLIANVDNGPSPYYLLERTAEEQAQVFAPTPLTPAPQDITGLGLDADWFGEEQQLMTTDGRVLVTVTVTWQHGSTARKIAVTSAVARTYLGPNDYAATKLYP